jgi:DNA polymerase-3 subunit delta'
MSWCGIVGHDAVAECFRRGIELGRLATTFLFVGLPGIGKRTFALRLAQALQCEKHTDRELSACQNCPSCRQVAGLSHPDVEYISKPEDRSFIPLEFFIGDKEHRMREGLCHWIGLKPYYGRRKIAIIDDADYLNQEGANCLLKTLEEPPPRSMLILIGTSQQRQLPTIRSRCQIVRFDPLAREFISEKLLSLGIARDVEHARRLAEGSEGSFDRAMDWAQDELAEFRDELWNSLSTPSVDSLALAKRISEFVDAAGKEAPPRRARLRLIIEMFLAYLRHVLFVQAGSPLPDRHPADKTMSSAIANWKLGPETTAHWIERCVEAELQVSANANVSTLIESWIDDMFTYVPVD